jgi:hypothetical protein
MRRLLRNYFQTEDDFRARWPLQPGDFPNFGSKSIAKLGSLVGLAIPEPPPIPTDIASMSDDELRALVSNASRELRRRSRR